ncbi:MAG TPA: cupin domain-containing protein [Firmicutes bacterium]|nr:cupin domain-containing protein [Bacillota bacterium]
MARKLSIHQLAELSGLSASLISQVERDVASPSVVSLWKIANALEVSVGDFFGTPAQTTRVVRKNQRKGLVFPSSKVIYELLTPTPVKDFEFLLIRIEPGQDTSDGTITHPGKECGFILQGTMEIQVGEEFYTLEEGDSIFFDSTTPHRLRNKSGAPVVAVWVDCPPMF